ncbi:hypothetical protein N7541_003377 [Penicillium brevicompactum]|uniref:Rrn9 domain-containing protein n=1 Tax=Penicillium brevicompactum TaxID=5074 RepID=A0A9W9RRM2_PENBR|nr:hypothetical protein N7541_003377 [Penicillium brevicompactum]
MSSFSESHVPGSDFLPPESAQVPKSLFGGPSSDVDLQPSSQPERSRPSLARSHSAKYVPLGPIHESDIMDEAPDEVEEDHDILLNDRPLTSDYDSNDENVRSSPRRGRSISRRNLSSQIMQSSPPAAVGATSPKPEPEPIRYVVDRGLDLPPGTERPNLFQGAASSWRRYNADDIGACTALITERSRDLGAHLYNAHMVRRRLRDSHQKHPETNEESTIELPKRWTAWPMPASQVPRLGELLNNRMDQNGSMRMAPDPRPSADLEESITAFILGAAKNKYRAREWDYEDVKSDLDKRIGDKDDMMAEELEKKEYGRPLSTIVLRPTIQADDGKSAKQLRPLARNVITQIDKLLYGLHCAMKGRKFEEGSEHDERTDDEISDEEFYDWDSDEDDGDDDGDDSNERPQERTDESRSRSRGRKPTQDGSFLHQQSVEEMIAQAMRGPNQPTQEEEVPPDLSPARSQSPQSVESQEDQQNKSGRMQLRDWSEVLGLASMMDLPSAAVMRASKRCADLFGEDMEFHTMAEGRVKKKRNNNGQWVYTYTESDLDDESAPATPQPASRASLEQSPNLQPESRATPKKYKNRSKQAKTPAIVPPSDSSSPEPEAAADTNPPPPTKERGRSRPGRGKGAHRKLDIVCPLEACSRHTKGFSRTWNLNQHMKKAHPTYAPVNERSNSRGAAIGGDEDLIQVD